MTRDAHIASRCAQREYSVNTADMLCLASAVAVVELPRNERTRSSFLGGGAGGWAPALEEPTVGTVEAKLKGDF